MKVEMWKLSDVKPYERNPRINDDAVADVAASIREFGWRQPIVVDTDGIIIVGHTRWKAAHQLGLESVPVHVAVDLPPEKAKAYRIADNQSASLSTWNMDLLPIELQELHDAGFDMALLGFGDALAKMMNPGVSDGLTDPDEIPGPPDAATTRPGDLWILGDHRLLCGDSARPADLDVLLEGAAIHLVNTDPPYNVRVAPRSNNAIAAYGEKPIGQQGMDTANKGRTIATTEKLRPKDRPLANDFVSDEDFARMLEAWFGNVNRVLQPGRAFYIWGGYSNIANYPTALRSAKLYFSQMIIWVKEHPVLTRKDFMGNHEWCFYGWREGAAHVFHGPPNVTDVWTVKKVSPQAMVHLTEKPVELAIRSIQYSTVSGENVLDLFGGSGSTMIAAEQTRRRAYLMEIDPLYCDVIVARWEAFTGRRATRIANPVADIPDSDGPSNPDPLEALA